MSLAPPFPTWLAHLALVCLALTPAAAEEISFDEVPPANASSPTLHEEYAALGAHFVTTDDGSLWSGLSAGDPGGWGLEGTNGHAFLGFNGRSYGLSVAFDEPVRGVAVDVARSSGSRAGDSFTMRGWRDGVVVEEVSLVLGAVNAWTTVALAEEVDRIEWTGVGMRSFHPYGVDHLRWTAEPPVLPVAIDVKPRNPQNPLNPFAQGVVRVALLGAADLDVAQVDVASLGFGPNAAPAVQARVRDVDGDGLLDLVTAHRVPETGIAIGDDEACLAGALHDGTGLLGCDAVRTIPGQGRGAHGGGPADRGASR
jgi:hypothetical protein